MKTLRSLLIGLCLLLTPLVSFAGAVTAIQGAPVQTKIIATGMTTNTTTATATGVIVSGGKTFFGQVVCSSGVCTQTQTIFGAFSATATNGVLICTITLSATPRAQDACPVVTAAFPYYYITTTNTTGTGATGDVYVMF